MATTATIADLLAGYRDTQIFSGLIRQVDSVNKLLQDSNSNIVLLAPANSIMLNLQSKPWEKADDYQVRGSDAYESPDGQDLAQKNIQRLVEAHVITTQGTIKGGEKIKTLAGTTLWMSEDGSGKKSISPDAASIIKVEVASNGQIWIIDRLLKDT